MLTVDLSAFGTADRWNPPPDAEIAGDEALYIRFDDDNDDLLSDGDDYIWLDPSGFEDYHFSAAENQYVPDVSSDGTAASSGADGTIFFEFAHPLSSGDTGDLAIGPGSMIGLCLRYWQDGTFTCRARRSRSILTSCDIDGHFLLQEVLAVSPKGQVKRS